MIESATLEIALQHVTLREWYVNKDVMYLLHRSLSMQSTDAMSLYGQTVWLV